MQKSKKAKKPKKQLNLKLPKDRWAICREVRVPSFYTTPGKPDPHTGKPSEPKPVKVATHITKAVLTDIAQYDWPGNSNFKGNANIAHGTGLSIRSVSKGVAVLKSIGALRRTSQGVKKPAVSSLDWDLLETLREPFRGGDTDTPVGPNEEDAPDDFDEEPQPLKTEDIDDDDDDVSDLGPAAPRPEKTGSAAKDLVDLIMEFGPYHRIRPAVETVIKGLLKDKSPEEIKTAWENLPKDRRAMAVRAKSPGAYLRTMLANAIDQPQQESEENDDDWAQNEEFMRDIIGRVKSTGVHQIGLAELSSDASAASFARWATKWCDQHAPEVEYEVDLPNKEIRVFVGALTR